MYKLIGSEFSPAETDESGGLGSEDDAGGETKLNLSKWTGWRVDYCLRRRCMVSKTQIHMIKLAFGARKLGTASPMPCHSFKRSWRWRRKRHAKFSKASSDRSKNVQN